MKRKKCGRKEKDLDIEQIRELAHIQCTQSEIAAVMRCSVDTLDRRYAETIREGREVGKMSLRRAQYKKALEGNPAMLIWLGKHILGQRDEITLNAGSESEVRALLAQWDVTAKKKHDYSKLNKPEKATPVMEELMAA